MEDSISALVSGMVVAACVAAIYFASRIGGKWLNRLPGKWGAFVPLALVAALLFGLIWWAYHI